MTFEPLWPQWTIVLPVIAAIGCLAFVFVRRGTRLAWIRRAVAFAAVAVMAAGPSVTENQATAAQSNAEIFFVVDLTGSMGALDFDGQQQRLVGVRHDLVAISAEFPGSRFALIAWDSQTTVQLPLTTDARAVSSWAGTATRESTASSSGSKLDRPLEALTNALQNSVSRAPQNVRLVYFLSDGENMQGTTPSADVDLDSYEGLAGLVDGGAVLGYGTPEGGQMRVRALDVPDEEAELIQDSTGSPAVSRLDEKTLRGIAEQLGIPYVHRFTTDAVDDIVAGVDLATITGDGRRTQAVTRPVVWPLGWMVLGVMTWEAVALAGLLRRETESAS